MSHLNSLSKDYPHDHAKLITFSVELHNLKEYFLNSDLSFTRLNSKPRRLPIKKIFACQHVCRGFKFKNKNENDNTRTVLLDSLNYAL